jgi:hypothetical protein
MFGVSAHTPSPSPPSQLPPRMHIQFIFMLTLARFYPVDSVLYVLLLHSNDSFELLHSYITIRTTHAHALTFARSRIFVESYLKIYIYIYMYD